MATIPLTVPDGLHATYLVPASRTAESAAEVLERALAAPGPEEGPGAASINLTRNLLGRGIVQVEWVGAPGELLPSFDHLSLFGATPDQLRALADSPAAIVVNAIGLVLPGYPVHEIGARTAANRLALAVGSEVVLDMFTPRLLPAASLLPGPDAAGPLATADLVLVPQSAGERGNWITTKGLGRFGLPELQVLDVPPPVGGAWTSIVTGIAATLLDDFAEAVERATTDGEQPAIVEVDDRLELTTRAIAAAYGSEVDDEVARTLVQLRFDPSPDPDFDDFLTVRAPDDYGRSAGEFHLSVVHDLFGADEGEIRYTESDDEGMRAAIETARSCLDVARERFLAREFEHRRLLIVKYRLEVGDQVEFPWLFVTDWSDPNRLVGSSAVDAEHDPTIRTGRPVSTTLDLVADWGVWVDGGGVIEGGWTNAYLQGDPPPPVPMGSAPAPKPRSRWRRKG
jgi:hypothetical protein